MHNNNNVVITKDVGAELKKLIQRKNPTKIAVLVDENTSEHCFSLIQEVVPAAIIVQIESGEENKTLTTCQFIWQKLTDHQFDRKALLINLGGGVIGDMGGFCAATYKRGISFVQIPTTLLSQVDASVGGKLGIDFYGFKNHIGVFKVPDEVIIDTLFLKTLHTRELRSGFAEIIKHCLIADSQKWEELTAIAYQSQNWDNLVAHSIGVKDKITLADPFEAGLRKILNFGHTIGHAIETHFLQDANKKLLHGEAIAIGMICEAYLSLERGYLEPQELDALVQYILSIYGKVKIEDADIEALIPHTMQDKKNESNTILASLLEEIGKANYNISLTEEDIERSIYYYNSL
jgi:3-dehydroquinate synthase